MYVESYKHYYAKEVLKSWLSSDKINMEKKEFIFKYTENEYNNNVVELEYPIYKNGSMDSIKYNWNLLLGDGCNPLIPTYDQLKQKRIFATAIIDLVILDKNTPKYYIEVCHKHATTPEKIEKLKALGIDNLYEIDAGWILDQIKKPQYLKLKRLI